MKIRTLITILATNLFITPAFASDELAPLNALISNDSEEVNYCVDELLVGAEQTEFPTEEVATTDTNDQLAMDTTEVTDDELNGLRGAFSPSLFIPVIQTTAANQNAVVTGNSVTGGITGDNLIDTSAFNGSAGLITVMQNSGNNVLFQNSTQVNINIGSSCSFGSC